MPIELPKRARPYIQRLHDDPRTRVMAQGWIAQATFEAEQQVPHPEDYRLRAHRAAEIAVMLAMTHVLDNDAELAAAHREIDELRGKILQGVTMLPPTLVIPKEQAK